MQFTQVFIDIESNLFFGRHVVSGVREMNGSDHGCKSDMGPQEFVGVWIGEG